MLQFSHRAPEGRLEMSAMANRVIGYFRESREELRKVSWPAWPETRNNTLLVIGISLFVAAFLGLCDLVFSAGLQYVTQR